MSAATETDRVAALARPVVADHDPKSVPVSEFLGACYDTGLSSVHFPKGLGGLGLSHFLQAVADEILHAAGGPVSPAMRPMEYGMAAPTVCEHPRGLRRDGRKLALQRALGLGGACVVTLCESVGTR
ncbi:hypothetical protein AWC19_09685 [Mycobacterium palustre]|uniref:Acyl-CoA dehydrogenase/oxidase N-terminal domain-containing protein n=1 Tax=Mycobacterium palustre TaxID=153971 RepID=A0A1X1ZLW1_9MYCO|nr:hypothetical protein AWC19_09685 [Mycobacterium palustre]